MKKSTLIKVLCLIVVALSVFALVACGGTGTTEDNSNKIAIWLDPNGGELDGDDVIYVNEGDPIGKLPTPTRGGYDFLGWFEDGNERWEVDRRTKAEYEMEIVALWQAKGDLVTVEFSVSEGLGEQLFGDLFIEVVEGERIASAIKSLPYATRDGYKFKGWKDQNNTTVTLTTKVDKDMVLTPMWEQVIFCLDGTENHAWNAWQEYSEATCTLPAQNSRTCGICGHVEYNVTQEATGHIYSDWATVVNENGANRARSCASCGYAQTEKLQNIAFENFKTPVIDGSGWGLAKGANLINGNYTDRDIAGDGKGAITVTIEAKQATYVDIFAVTGQGSGSYVVTVYYANGTSKDIGVGSFGSGDTATKAFTIEDSVTKFVVYMESPSNGTDYWSELSVLVNPSD